MVPCWIGKVTGKRKAVGEIQPDVFDVKLFNINLFKPKVELTLEKLVLSRMTYGAGFVVPRVNIADRHQTACMSPWRSFKPHPKKRVDFKGLVL